MRTTAEKQPEAGKKLELHSDLDAGKKQRTSKEQLSAPSRLSGNKEITAGNRQQEQAIARLDQLADEETAAQKQLADTERREKKPQDSVKIDETKSTAVKLKEKMRLLKRTW